MKKKLIALLLCLALFATLVACAGKTTTEPTQNSQPAQDSTTTTDETTPDNTTDEQPQENTDAASYEQIDSTTTRCGAMLARTAVCPVDWMT